MGKDCLTLIITEKRHIISFPFFIISILQNMENISNYFPCFLFQYHHRWNISHPKWLITWQIFNRLLTLGIEKIKENFMPFINEAINLVRTLPANTPLRITLDYLLDNGIGRNNPVPLNVIVNHIISQGINISRTEFQQTVLKETREGDIFIGTSNRGCFLIQDVDDAIVVRDFYENRIRAEQHHLDNLRSLASINGWMI